MKVFCNQFVQYHSQKGCFCSSSTVSCTLCEPQGILLTYQILSSQLIIKQSKSKFFLLLEESLKPHQGVIYINNQHRNQYQIQMPPFKHQLILEDIKIIYMDNCDYTIHEGIFTVQSGHRNTIAVIQCPYISQKIQVNDALDLQILDASQVYWRQVRRFYVNRKGGQRHEQIIVAQVLGLKYCNYIFGGINIISTLEIQKTGDVGRIIGRPINKRLPHIEIIDFCRESLQIQNIETLYPNLSQFYYWVQIIQWNYKQKYPKAVVTGIFSKAKTAQSQTEAILYNLQIDQRESLLTIQRNIITPDYLPISKHKQFNELVFTIDPPYCQDMQDALSLRLLDSNLYQIGVHIADVSSFMNLVDRKQICLRGTSFYLPHKTISLFPKQITQLCSFQEGRSRLSFSVFFTMNENGDILDTSFQKTIIKNKAKMTYQEAQQILEEKTFDIFQFCEEHSLEVEEAEQLVKKLKLLKIIAFNRRKIRKSQQILDRNQVTFDLDKNNIPIRVGIKKRFDSERLVQEFMIATNGEVAKKLVRDYGSNAIVIHHPKPTQSNVNSLNSFFSDFGVIFKNDSIISLQAEVKKLFEKQGVKDQYKEALMMRAIQIQQLAVYSRSMNSQKGHFGLNMEYYTHFTSPLRRFADVIVHEQLNECLTRQGSSKCAKYNPRLDEEIQYLNKGRLKNKKLRHSIVEGFLNLFLYKNKEKIRAKGMIMSLGLKSVTLYLPFYNLIKQVNWSSNVTSLGKDSVRCELFDKQRGKFDKIFCVNDSVDVQVEHDIHQQVKLIMLVKNSEEQHQIRV